MFHFRFFIGLIAPSVGLWGILESLESGDYLPRILGIILIVAGIANVRNLSYEMTRRWK